MNARLTPAANLVLAGAGSACSLALMYFLYHYEWTGERVFTSWIGPLIYYLIPASLSVLFFGSLRLPPLLRAKLVLVTTSTLLSLYAVEITLEAMKPEPTLWSVQTPQEKQQIVRIAKRYGVTYDTRTQLQVVKDMQAKGLDAVPAVYPNGFLVQQPDGSFKSQFVIKDKEVAILGGISDRPTIFCNESGDWITYHSDEHGFHNPSGIWSSPSIDIVVLGDSYAQGTCVSSDRSFAGRIRRRYPSTLNLGMSSAGPLTTLATLKEYAAQFRPREVLWFFYEENDFADLTKERKSPLLMQYLYEEFSQGLLESQQEIDTLVQDYVARRMSTATIGVVGNEKAVSFGLPAVLRLGNLRERLHLVHGTAARPLDHRVVTSEAEALLTAILSHAKTTVSSWGGTLHLVYLPERERYAISQTARFDDDIRRRVLTVADSLALPVIDIHSAFQSDRDPLRLFPFRRRGHYNEEGHQLVADTVLRSLDSVVRH